jgi:hypothetical protein
MRALSSTLKDSIADEFANAALGDPRRTRRLQSVATSAMKAPSVGFPQMVADDGELEGLYRFLSNENVDADDVLAPHIAATMRRTDTVEKCLVIHDTTEFTFGGRQKRRGLGVTNGMKQGFLAHVALAVLPGEERVPLGVCGLTRICRPASKGSRFKSWYQLSRDPKRESLRWGALVQAVEKGRGAAGLVHVMDREGDIYDLLALMTRSGAGFVVRAAHDRALADTLGLLQERLAALKPMVRRTIELGPRLDENRSASKKRANPTRTARKAIVAISACRVQLRRTQGAHSEEETLGVNVVHVWEPKPPHDTPAASWTLYTTEPIETATDVARVVDFYRSRWVIEEFFKALKTGCAIEKRQLESYKALSTALSVFMPVAWRLLLARSLRRAHPEKSARVVLSDLQLRLVQQRLELDRPPRTVREAVDSVAKLGGHLQRNGPPGWLTLGRGFEVLLWMQAGWEARERFDQS